MPNNKPLTELYLNAEEKEIGKSQYACVCGVAYRPVYTAVSEGYCRKEKQWRIERLEVSLCCYNKEKTIKRNGLVKRCRANSY
jgi:hypothetical protein